MRRTIGPVLALLLIVSTGVLTTRLGEATAQEIKLKLSHLVPPSHIHHANVIVPWVEEVKRKTGGRVEITVFPAASLCKPAQQYECAKSGLADIAWAVTGWTPGRFMLTSVLELPFIQKTAAVGNQMLADLWERYLKNDYDDVHLLYLFLAPAVHVHTASKPVRTLEDLRGLKIRVTNAVQGDALAMLGATQIGMPAPQIYEAMSQRVIDGFTLTWEALLPFRLLEVSKHYTEVSLSAAVFAVFMNKGKYDSLPPEVRKVLDETTSPTSGYWRRVGEIWDKGEAAARKVVVERKANIYVLPKEERRRWRDAVKGLDEKWAASLEARGHPGRALLKDARALTVKYGETD